MKLSFEILDYIFSFLVSDPRTLIACSKDPLLFQLAERHLYYSITVCFKFRAFADISLESNPHRLSELVSENPRILHYVRILRIQVILDHSHSDLDIMKDLEQFAKTLLMFPALECIRLVTSKKRLCDWPNDFRAALEDRLNLPTLKEVHIVGNQDFPCCFIDNRKNIEHLLLSSSFEEAKRQCCVSTLPRLKSLTLLTRPRSSFLASITPHISEIRSLKCAASAVRVLPELLGICSQTLNNLDIDLLSSCYCSNYTFLTGEFDNIPLPELFPVPPNLQRLTLRAAVTVQNEFGGDRQESYGSYLPAAAQVINTFVSPLHHLILDIDLYLHGTDSNLAAVDFSPLAVLGAASKSIPRIDLYIHSDFLSSTVTLAHLLSCMADLDDIMKSIKEGKLVIHSEKTAPDYVGEDSG